MSAKLTKWFPASVKPVHVGVYETSSDGDKGYQFFDGVHWKYWSHSVALAYTSRKFISSFQKPKWRGLAVKP